MNSHSTFHLVYCTCGNAENAEQIATVLVTEQLAACVTILPGIRSVYRWQGKIESEQEVLLIIKTRAECLPRLQERVCALHTYELPEIVAVPIVAGLETYLNWISESVSHHD